MRPHVCIPSGCQQWVSKTIAVGIDKFAYMSSLAIYVYSSHSFLPLAILAKHEQHLSALAMSPFDSNLLACAINNQEVRVYDVDTEQPVCRTKYSAPKDRVTLLTWHRTKPGVLLMAIGSCLVAWDFAASMDAGGGGEGHAHGRGHGHANGGGGGGAVPPPPPSSPPPQAPRSMLARFRNHHRGPGGAAGADSSDPGPAGRWSLLRDVGAAVTAFDQCAAPAAGGAGGGLTLVAVATADARVVLLELDPTGLMVRGEQRTIVLPDVAGGGGSAAAAAGIGPASAVSWEPLSGNGLLLVVGRGGAMALYDTTVGEVVLSYAKQPATAARFAQFLPSQPGSFLLSSSRSGALQLWNVSQPHPLRLVKLGGGLVQAFALLSPSASGSAAGGGGGGGGGGAECGGGVAKRTAMLVSFGDGALYVYDMDSQQVLWRQEGGHTETVFDCRFCTTDPNLLATASFDSSVRVWDIRTAHCIKRLQGAEGILYSVSWSCDGRMLAASNDSGVIYLYDYGRGMMIRSLKQHTKQALKVTFHPLKANMLASSSVDGTVYVYTTDGEMVRTLRHFSTVSCIAWGLLCPHLLATTCEEGEMHVWDVTRPAAECLVRTLTRHSSRSFNVEFSPLLRHHLLSSSNDRTARVWDVSSGDCLAVLQGHTAEVRAVAWHPEVAHICFTGSWDSSIRVWDVRNGRCLHVANDHHADVYGIAIHPQRPFFMVTCSRDTTLRLWSTLELTPNLMPQALLRSLSQLRATPEEAAALPQSAQAVISGACSGQLAERLAAASCTPLERYAAISEFFLPPACVDVFWDLAGCVSTNAGGSDPGGGGSGGAVIFGPRQRPGGAADAPGGGGGDDGYSLHHWTAARLAVGSAANHLELAASSKSRISGGAGRREDLLREAAQQHLVAGNVEHCCELLADLGDWDRALALAPVVGLPFWQRLLGQRVQALAEAETQSHVSDVLPLYLVSGQVPALVDMLSTSCLYDTAFNVAAVQACGGYPSLAGGGAAAAAIARELCNSAGGVANGAAAGDQAEAPPLQRSPSVGFGSAAGAWGPTPPGLDRIRSSCSTDFNTLPSPSSNAGGGGLTSLQLSSATSLASSISIPPLPPVTLRGGSLPSLGRAPPLRPPPLAPIPASTMPPTSPPAASASTSAAAQLPPSDASAPDSPRASNAAASGFLNDSSSQLLPPPPPPPLPPPSPPLAYSSLAPAPPPGLRSTGSSRQRSLPNSAAPGATSAGGGGGAAAAASGSSSSRDALQDAVSVRCSQARMFLSQGLPLQAACCALTVDDLPGAVGLLLRGGMEDMALALVQGLMRTGQQHQRNAAGVAPAAAGVGLGAFGLVGVVGVGFESGSGAAGGLGAGGVEAVAAALRPRVLVAAAMRREAAGEHLTAAELIMRVPGRGDLRDLLAGRCRAHCDPPTAARVFAALDLRDPPAYSAAAEDPATMTAAAASGWEGVRLLLLAGQQAAAADRALAGLRQLLEGGERVTLASPDWEQAWGAINSLCSSALGGSVWSRVFAAAAYLGALVALEQGCAAVGIHLVRVLEAWVAGRADAELPVSQARLAAEVSEALDACLALPAYGSPGEVREVLQELVLAPAGSQWLQGMLQSRLASSGSPQPPSGVTSPNSSGRSIRSPPSGAAGGGECILSPTGRPSLHGSRRLAGLGASGASTSLRLGSLDLGPSTGRLTAGGALFAALSALQPSAAAAAAAASGSADGGAGGGGGGGRRRRRSGAAAAAAASLADLAQGPVVVAAAHVPSRSSSSLVASGALPTSAVSGAVIRGAAVLLDDGTTRVSLSEALALRRAMAYSPLGTGKLLSLP